MIIRALGGTSLYITSLWLGFLWWGSSLKEVRASLPGFVLRGVNSLALFSLARGCKLSYTPTFVFEGVQLNTHHMWFVFESTCSINYKPIIIWIHKTFLSKSYNLSQFSVKLG